MTKPSILILLTALAAPSLPAQSKPAPRTSRYIPTIPLDFRALLPPPPATGSPAAQADSLAVHQAESTRTPEQIAQAQLDDQTESIFIYADIVGPRLSLADIPLTAALSQHLREESGVVNPSMKLTFHRPRPGKADPTLHPVCEASKSDSYPSGHAMVGYLEAFALTQMLPEQSAAILARADAYAHNRIVCGVHYPTDTEASRTTALALIGALATSTRFREELNSARAELRAKLTPTH